VLCDQATQEGVGRWKISSLMAEFIVTFEEKKAGFGANIAAGDVDGSYKEKGKPEKNS
jgi:hypothetical protein